MEVKILENLYGKGSIKLMKLNRNVQPHRIMDMEVDVILKGDLDGAFTAADNSKVVPTDTMKNTVYILAKKFDFTTIEEFGIILAKHFLSNYDQITYAEIEILQNAWTPIRSNQGAYHSSFLSPDIDKKHCKVIVNSDNEITVISGIRELTILKSSNSGFENYVVDEYTTLKPTADRVFATTLGASWTYKSTEVNYSEIFNRVKTALLDSFATHQSKSVQHTLYDMGKKVLAENEPLATIRLLMPNEHKILVNLEPFNLENNNEIFVPTDEPFGVIEAELSSQ